MKNIQDWYDCTNIMQRSLMYIFLPIVGSLLGAGVCNPDRNPALMFFGFGVPLVCLLYLQFGSKNNSDLGGRLKKKLDDFSRD